MKILKIAGLLLAVCFMNAIQSMEPELLIPEQNPLELQVLHGIIGIESYLLKLGESSPHEYGSKLQALRDAQDDNYYDQLKSDISKAVDHADEKDTDLLKVEYLHKEIRRLINKFYEELKLEQQSLINDFYEALEPEQQLLGGIIDAQQYLLMLEKLSSDDDYEYSRMLIALRTTDYGSVDNYYQQLRPVVGWLVDFIGKQNATEDVKLKELHRQVRHYIKELYDGLKKDEASGRIKQKKLEVW